MTHLAPFVDQSRQIIRKEVESEMEGLDIPREKIDEIVERRVRREVRDGIQTIQYQVITLLTTNGQAPFLSVFMYLNEAGEDEQLKHDLALCIEEMLEQRTQGVKNEVGAWVSPAFPKLLYVLEEDNVTPDGEYFYLTQKAVHCSVKRLTPDYISEKVMKANKVDSNGNGQCYPCIDKPVPSFGDETRKPI